MSRRLQLTLIVTLIVAGSLFAAARRRAASPAPTPEGALAQSNPFTPPQYVPLALTNRFDLAPANGANCGQYRAIYARRTNVETDRLHIIFEATLPNPDPAAGLAGCRPVAEFWA